MRVIRSLQTLAGIVALALAACPVSAHHSFAMFDATKTITLEGTIKEFQWTNPHSWIQIMVKDPATGKEVEWSIEALSPNYLARAGWKRTTLKPGDKAKIIINPLKDGTAGGALKHMFVDGVDLGSF